MNMDNARDTASPGGPAAPDAWQAAVDNGIDMNEVEYLLSLTPEQRLHRHDQALQLGRALRVAGTEFYGFDPRHSETLACE